MNFVSGAQSEGRMVPNHCDTGDSVTCPQFLATKNVFYTCTNTIHVFYFDIVSQGRKEKALN